MQLMCLISTYAALHVLMMCCFLKRSLSTVQPKLRTIPANSTSVLLREIVCGCCKVVLTVDDDEKRIPSVCFLFGLSFFLSFLDP